MEKQKLKHSINAHDDDINSICYIDKKNSNLIISGSDDCSCKIWDSRIISNNKPVGIFYGHICGVTHVESRQDNLYFLSNSKDQSVKLWDLRSCSNEKVAPKEFGRLYFDYRNSFLEKESLQKFKEVQNRNQYDKSLMTFWGHKTYVTLIRAHFSPRHCTDQRFIYTGSADGKVFIYDILDGKHVATLELKNSEDKCIRDLAWHPETQQMITSDFSGDIHLWQYKDLEA